MKLSCSSLSTLLYSQLPQQLGTGRKSTGSNLEPDAQAIVRTVRWISDIGLESMDLHVTSETHLSMLSTDEDAEKIAQACAEHSVEINHVRCNFLGKRIFHRPDRRSVEEVWGSIAKLAGMVGADTIETVSSPVPLEHFGEQERGNPAWPIQEEVPAPGLVTSWEESWSTFVAAMRRHVGLAENHGLRLALEARPREFLANTDSLLRLMDAVTSERLGAVFDVSHAHVVRDTLSVSVQKLGAKIFCVHLSDNDGVTESHWPPGQGQINWGSVIRALNRVGYDGPVCLDVSGVDVEHEVLEGKSYVESLLRKVAYSSQRLRG
ncbi:MAG: sugar phosphate isomerase/epimerase [Nitrososphaerota archaeon]|nr:sugar phosphate isomerase/epimerase [Nitrososphaerota archaeon]MDG6947267.1 sugar phosphate isomerase/epimerase [Nitrososphaerota archaeon]MDG6955300.1 sugar phosphate isomerase/epimerase [Nitrososphaerota archaeon]